MGLRGLMSCQCPSAGVRRWRRMPPYVETCALQMSVGSGCLFLLRLRWARPIPSRQSLGVAFFVFMFSFGIIDLARASLLALEKAALIILNIGLPCRSVPWILLIMLGGSLEAMVYRARALNAKASSFGP